MKVLIESYNCVRQNDSGGMQIRIKNFMEHYKKASSEIKLFDKWEDKVVDHDLLHIFKVNMEDYQLVKLAKNNKIPVVISSVVPLENKFQILFNRTLCRLLPVHTGYWFINQMLKEADAIIVESKKEAKFISKNYGVSEKRIHTIPNGVDANIGTASKNEFSKRTGIYGKYVLQVGRFDQNKNQLNVIKAMAGSDIPVVFIGGADSGDSKYYDECRRNATSNMHFIGWVDHNDPLLSSAYQNAHVVILPSFKETFGISLIEGGAAGGNLIASKDLPIFEWDISDICKAVNPSDVDDIRNSIIDAYIKPLNPLTSIKVRNKFSWDSIVAQHIDIYKRVSAEVGYDEE
jgi:glycosyltransferase involved in cell wall biosynthesis